MNCTIVSPQKTRKFEQLKAVTLPAYSGEMQVLAGHAEAFILLKKGNIIIDDKTVEISGGECHIKDDNIIIIL
jgi:F0F1-type ATP synthase epsilon subunit